MEQTQVDLWVVLHEDGEDDTFAVGPYFEKEDADASMRELMTCGHKCRVIPALTDVRYAVSKVADMVVVVEDRKN